MSQSFRTATVPRVGTSRIPTACPDPRPGWSALAVVGLLAGITTLTPAPSATAAPAARPTASEPLSTTTPSPSVSGRPGPSATPTASTAVPTTPTSAASATAVPQGAQRSAGSGGGARTHVSARPGTATEGVPGAQDARPVEATWTWHLPSPETGLKIFAAGLLGLAVAIGGLATLAIRRRGY